MHPRGKRASLSSTLLAPRDTPFPEEGTAPLPVTAESVLCSKGNASAAGFRPASWSFDPEAPLDEEPGTNVMLFPVAVQLPAQVREPEPPPLPEPAEVLASEIPAPLPAPIAEPVVELPAEPVDHPPAEPVDEPAAEAPLDLVPTPTPEPIAPIAVAAPPAVAPIVAPTPRPEVLRRVPPPPPPAERKVPIALASGGVAALITAVFLVQAAIHHERSWREAFVPAAVDTVAADLDAQMVHGDELMATGHVLDARGIYQRAADRGSAAAALALARTYDPVYLKEIGAHGVRGDMATAITWYKKAGAAGERILSARGIGKPAPVAVPKPVPESSHATSDVAAPKPPRSVVPAPAVTAPTLPVLPAPFVATSTPARIAPPPPSSPTPATVSPEIPVAPIMAAPAVHIAPDLKSARDCARPAYPVVAQARNEAGTVVLQLLVGSDGRVVDSRVAESSGYAKLDEAAQAALSRCHFTPGTVDGVPEVAWANLKYTWRLE